MLSVTDPVRIRELQRLAVEESRLKIPILFAFDTIHGFRTIFPIPLAAGASFDPQVAGRRQRIRRARVRSRRAQADVRPDGRRLARAPLGPDRRGGGRGPVPQRRARRRAREGASRARTTPRRDKLVSSPKHFAAYGQPEAGRDYNTTDLSEQRLRNLYLPPFKAAIEAGADTAMCSFNAINGVPGCAQRLPHERDPQGRVGLRRLRRERLDCGVRDARLPAEEPRRVASAATAWPRTAPAPPSSRSTPASTPR